MSRKTDILSVSFPHNLTKAIDAISKKTDQTRSELIRSALRDYILDMEGDRQRFVDAYAATRKEKTMSLENLRKKYDLA